MKIQRLIGLICVLADVDKITVQELADRFEVSKRTIFRDLDTLNLAGGRSDPGPSAPARQREGQRHF